MRSDDAVVVEFVGLPATGKTHVATEVKSRLEEIVSPDEGPIRTTSERREKRFNRLQAVRYILSHAIRNPRKSGRAIPLIKQTKQPDLLYQLRYIGYLLYVAGEINAARRRGEIFLVDQGFFQHLWRIHLTGDTDSIITLSDLVETYLGTIAPDIIVFVSVDHETRMERAIDRGTSVEPELFDPTHPLITDDHEAYEDVRTILPMLTDDCRIIDIENDAEQLRTNVEVITRSIMETRNDIADMSISSEENQFGSASGR